MKNYFYMNEIAEKIKELIDLNLAQDEAKNISIGDFTVLPAPQYIDKYLPAVIINPEMADIEPANEALKIYQMMYSFTIYYLYPITFENDMNHKSKSKVTALKIANILMTNENLGCFNIEKSAEEAGGQIVNTKISKVSFDTAEEEIFKALEIPVHIAGISFFAGFRTYR